jgi:hypothetical protein
VDARQQTADQLSPEEPVYLPLLHLLPHLCPHLSAWSRHVPGILPAPVVKVGCLFETSFDSKQPKLEPKLVSALSETKHLFRLFRFYTETASFGVSIELKQTEDQPKQTETNGNESINE